MQWLRVRVHHCFKGPYSGIKVENVVNARASRASACGRPCLQDKEKFKEKKVNKAVLYFSIMG